MKRVEHRKAAAPKRRRVARRNRHRRSEVATRKLRETAVHSLESLPTDKLKVAAEFIIYLVQSASDDATAELLRIPGFLNDVREAHEEIAAGKAVPWRKVRDNV